MTPPVVKAELQDGKTNIEDIDESTGIEAVYINGKQIINSAERLPQIISTHLLLVRGSFRLVS